MSLEKLIKTDKIENTNGVWLKIDHPPIALTANQIIRFQNGNQTMKTTLQGGHGQGVLLTFSCIKKRDYIIYWFCGGRFESLFFCKHQSAVVAAAGDWPFYSLYFNIISNILWTIELMLPTTAVTAFELIYYWIEYLHGSFVFLLSLSWVWFNFLRSFFLSYFIECLLINQ